MNKIQRIVFTMACLLTALGGKAYDITITQTEAQKVTNHGYIEAYDNNSTMITTANAGNNIILKVVPYDGYYFEKLEIEQVMDLGSAEAPRRTSTITPFITKQIINKNGAYAATHFGHEGDAYQFLMPENNIIIKATFLQCTDITSNDNITFALTGDATYNGSTRNLIVYDNAKTETDKTIALNTDYSINTWTYPLGCSDVKNAGTYSVTITGIGIYSGTKNSGSMTIEQRVLTITATNTGKIFRETDPTLEYTYSNLVDGENTTTYSVFTGALDRVVGENVGTYDINQGTLSAGDNYTIAYTKGYFTITQKDVSNTAVVTLNEYFHNYDGAEHKPTVSIVDEGDITLYENIASPATTKDYAVSYNSTHGVYTDNTDYTTPDIYTVTITYNGNYTGTKTVEYQIRKQLNLTDQAARWMTYYEATYNMEVISGFEAYTIREVTASSVTLEQRDFIRANNTPMLLYRSGDTKQFNLPLLKPTDASVTSSQNATTGWKLSDEYKICTSNMTLPDDIPSGKEIWILVDDHFMRTKSGTLIVGRCYIERSNSSYTSPMLSIGRKTTGIEEETIKNFDLNGIWYTLDGRKIQGIPAQKGIYINNGKKIIIK